jgi:magnesium transporter
LPTTAILRRLLLGRHIQLYAEDQDIVEDLLLNNEQSIENCQSNIKTVINIREAYSTIASNNLNRSMKWLTGATVMIALPNVFFGMYGMNVNLPNQTNSGDGNLSGFFMVVSLVVVTMVVVYIIGRRKKIF